MFVCMYFDLRFTVLKKKHNYCRLTIFTSIVKYCIVYNTKVK